MLSANLVWMVSAVNWLLCEPLRSLWLKILRN